MKKQLPYYSLIIFITAMLFIFTGCNKDQFELNKLSTRTRLNPEFSAPLIKGALNMSDLMEALDSTEFLKEDSTGLYYFAYRDSLISKSASEYLNIPDQDFIHLFIPSEYNIPAFLVQDTTIKDTISFAFSFGDDAQMDSIITNNFTFDHHVQYTYRNSAQIVIDYLNLTKNGVSYKDTILINDNSGNFDSTFSDVLNDYTATLRRANDSSYFTIAYEFTMFDDGYAIENDDYLDINSGINNIDLHAAFGYLGQDTLMLQESSIGLDFFTNTIEGNIEFARPEFNFYIENSLGVPVGVDLRNIRGYKENTTDTTYLTFDAGVNPFSINYPSLSEIGESKSTTISISNDNSNLSDFLAFKPDNIIFSSYGSSNPEGPNGSDNFITENGVFNAEYEITLPLWFQLEGLEMKDTMELDLESTLGNNEMIKELITTLEVVNGLPIDLDIQMYFMDSTMNMVDSLFVTQEEYIITGANVNTEGIVTSPNISAPEITIDKDKADRLGSVRKAIFIAGLRTSDYDQNQKVKFYSNYELSFKFYMDVVTEID